MKVIEILTKIANGEEVPKKVKVGYYYYEYEENGEYINTENAEDLLFDFDSYYLLEQCLNEEVEIIEEPKKIEKIEMCTGGIMSFDSVENITTELKNKINELIDEINNLKENKQ